METVVERPGALDVHKAQVTACVRVADAGGRRVAHLAQFATTVGGLLALRGLAYRVRRHARGDGGDGVYWKPVSTMVRGRLRAIVVNAQHVKNVALV